MATCSCRKAGADQRTAPNTNAGGAAISGSYDYVQEEGTGHIGLTSGEYTANIYLVQSSNTQVKITSTMFNDAYFNLSVSFKPTNWAVSNGHTGYTYVGDLNPTSYSHYILLTIGGSKYYFDCPWL